VFVCPVLPVDYEPVYKLTSRLSGLVCIGVSAEEYCSRRDSCCMIELLVAPSVVLNLEWFLLIMYCCQLQSLISPNKAIGTVAGCS
jgi:hypothetical protein